MDIRYYYFGFVFDIWFYTSLKNKMSSVQSMKKNNDSSVFIYRSSRNFQRDCFSRWIYFRATFVRLLLLFARIYDYRRVNRGRAPKGTENQVSWIVQMTRDLELLQKVVKFHVRIKQILLFFNFRNSNNFHFSYHSTLFEKLFSLKKNNCISIVSYSLYNLTINLLFNIKFYIQIWKFNEKTP